MCVQELPLDHRRCGVWWCLVINLRQLCSVTGSAQPKPRPESLPVPGAGSPGIPSPGVFPLCTRFEDARRRLAHLGPAGHAKRSCGGSYTPPGASRRGVASLTWAPARSRLGKLRQLWRVARNTEAYQRPNQAQRRTCPESTQGANSELA